MSYMKVEITSDNNISAEFNLDLLLKENDDTKELTSEVFNLFCNSVSVRVRVKWAGKYDMNIFTQLKALDCVTTTFLLHDTNAAKRVNILKTDLHTWQLIAKYENNIYHSSCYVNICISRCDRIPFKRLYDDADFTDFKLYAENNDVESVPVHRNVLAVSSPVLKSMLLGDWKEAKQGYVQPPGVSKTTLQHFKDYIYLKQLPDEPLDYAKLVTLASYYMLCDLPELEEKGKSVVSDKFKPENAWEWLEYCVQQKNSKLLLLRLRHFTQYNVLNKLEEYFEINGDVQDEDTSNNNYKDLYKDTDFTDFELRVEGEDGITFHKNVLGAFCPVMKTLLLSDWKEAKQGYVQLPNISKATIQHFKDYLYLKNLPEDSMDCTKLFALASNYMIPELRRDAAIKIAQNFKPENAWDWFEYCVQNNAVYLLVLILRNILNEYKIDTLEKYFLKKNSD